MKADGVIVDGKGEVVFFEQLFLSKEISTKWLRPVNFGCGKRNSIQISDHEGSLPTWEFPTASPLLGYAAVHFIISEPRRDFTLPVRVFALYVAPECASARHEYAFAQNPTVLSRWEREKRSPRWMNTPPRA
jgi:hypothetical protein